MSARKWILAVLAALLSPAAALALSAPAGAALVAHPYLFQITGTPSGPFSSEMCGDAVDPATGDLYVADPGSNAIDIFSAGGVYQSQISGASVPSGSFTEGACSVAVSDVTHDVYVADSGANVVYVFNSLGAWVSTMTGSEVPSGSFGGGLLVAVDQANGEIDVWDGVSYAIDRFDSEGKFRAAIHPSTEGEGVGGIVANTEGEVFIAETEAMYWYDSSGGELGHFYWPSGIGGVAGLALDANGHFYIGSTTNRAIVESTFAPSIVSQTSTVGTFPVKGEESSPVPEGVALGSGDLYVLEAPLETGFGNVRGAPWIVQVFGPEAVVPTAVTTAATDVLGTSATLNGTVNPEGEAATYQFEYGTSKACDCGSVTPASPASAGSDSSEHAFSAEATGLTPGTTYYYRIVATDAHGTDFGGEGKFTTPLTPVVTTGAAGGVSETAATVEGSVNPEERATTYQFEYENQKEYEEAEKYEREHRELPPGEYAQEKPYRFVSPSVAASIGSDTNVHVVSAGLSGLTPGTLYHYRLMASSSAGVGHGPDVTFHTQGPPTVDGEAVAKVTRTSAVVEATVDPDGFDTQVKVEYGPSESYGSSTAPVDAGSGVADQKLEVPLGPLAVGATYHFRVVVSNSHGTVDGHDVSFSALPAAYIEGESFSDVGTGSVAVDGKVDDLGTESSFFYEYGTSEAYGSATAAVLLGTVNGKVSAPAVLNGLQPDTVYHFRLVVSNETGVSFGADVVLRTLPLAPQGLPDGRGYELVTPSENRDADALIPHGQNDGIGATSVGGDVNGLPMQAAADGGAVTYVGQVMATTGGNGGTNEYLARRLPRGGWTQANLQPAGYARAKYRAFSPELTVGVLQSSDSVLPPLASGAPGVYNVLYTRGEDGLYHALFTATPPNRSSAEFETANRNEGAPEGLLYAGASADFGHLLFEANDALTAQAESDPPSVVENDLYDSVGGRPHLVNVLPGGAVAPDAVFGAPQRERLYAGSVFDHVISGDGSRVFWSDLSTGDLYVRENDASETEACGVAGDACTVQVDASQNNGVSGGEGLFWTASGDGSLVFFTDCRRLTSDSTAVDQGGCRAATSGSDLYEYNVESGALSDLTVDGSASDALGADVLGVLGASEDGSYVYFVAAGRLAAGASASEPNLYVEREGAIALITPLPQSAGRFQAGEAGNATLGVWQQSRADRTARVTPDGRHLVFATGYGAKGNVYVYGAEDGRLVCASCSPSVVVSSVGEHPVVGVAGGFLPIDEGEDLRQARWITPDGSRVFFDSPLPLVARDVNGEQDVYEWERAGTGSCTEEPGCVYLISSGTSSAESALIDASESGDDVFIVTRAKLVPQDSNDQFNVYDARVGAPVALAAAACSGTGCQGIPSAPPVFATPSSETFGGVGNFEAGSTSASAPKTKPKAKTQAKTKSKSKAKRKAKSKKRRRAKHARVVRGRGSRSSKGRSGR